jgi:hypothetical protein
MRAACLRALVSRAESAESDAAILREHVAEFEARLKAAVCEVRSLQAELADAQRAANGPRSLVLLHWGDVHSVHSSVHDAEEHAARHGADPAGWAPSTGLPARRVAWRTVVVTASGGESCTP